MDMVAIPFVNEGTGHILNDTQVNRSASFDKWEPGIDEVWKAPEGAEDAPGYKMQLSWFPYVIDMAKKICNAVGLTYDFSAWEQSKWNDLLLCNAVPSTWGFEWNMIMPHWSVLEFFRKLEPLLEGSFDIDLVTNHVSFRFYDIALDWPPVTIDTVIDEFSSEVYDENEQCKLLSMRYMGYAKQDSAIGRTYSCQWLLSEFLNGKVDYITYYKNARELSVEAGNNSWLNPKKPLGPRGWHGMCNYLEEEDRYVTGRIISVSTSKLNLYPWPVYSTTLVRVPISMNQFGPRCVPFKAKDSDSVDYTIDFIPAVIDDTDARRMLFLPLGDYEVNDGPFIDFDGEEDHDHLQDTYVMRRLDEGKDDGSKAAFSNIFVGFYPGASMCFRNIQFREIYPILDNFEMDLSWLPWYAENKEWTLSLQENNGKFGKFPKIDRFVKFEYSFITDRLPDVNSIFYIRGKRYLCERLTATFNESGMSQKVKGVFWQIVSE